MRALLCVLLTCVGDVAAGESGEATFLSNVRQLTFEGRRSGEGYFSADGKALVFQSERDAENPFYQIYLLDFESGETRRLSPGIGKTTCAFLRPNSDDVLFASTHHDSQAQAKQKAELEFRESGRERRYSWDYDAEMDIFTTTRSGGEPKRLTAAYGYDAEGGYSPDGRKIVFCSLRTAYPTNQLSAADLKRLASDPAYFGEIYIMNADGSQQQRLTHTPGYDGGPFFSPDGERIVWRHFETNGLVADVYTMKLDGSDVRRVTDYQSMSWAPYYHSSGDYIIFTANKHGFGNFELFLAEASGRGEPVRVTFTDGFDGLPVFSKDGSKLAWTSARGSDGKSQLFIGDWNHRAALSAVQGALPRGGNGKPTASLAKDGEDFFDPVQLSNAVVFLASEKLEGRATGSKGAALAADFIAGQLRSAGLEAMGESNTFFQKFSFNSGVRIITNQNNLSLDRNGAKRSFEVEVDYRPLAFSDNGTAEGEVVFAGYGLSVPGKPGEGYDSYSGLNVSNRVVLVLRYVPEEVEPKRRQELNRYAGLRYKALLARERGAKAILFVSGPNSPTSGKLASAEVDTSTAGSGIIAASVSSNFVQQLFSGSGHDLKRIQAELDRENPHAAGAFPMTNVQLRIATALEHIRKTDQNVLAFLPPSNGSSEIVVVGAHYDHLGFGESGAMLRSGEEQKVHHGADDNASGTAVVLGLARSLTAAKLKTNFTRGVLFALWSGEEAGVIGSSEFVERPPVPLSNIVACINFDMVGRLRDNKLMLQGVGSSPEWKRLIERRNVSAGFNAVLQEDPYLPTDVTPFYPRGIPVLNFFTGSHEDYHRPSDTAEKVNYAGMQRIGQFAHGIVTSLTTATAKPEYAKVASTRQQSGSREGLRAYLGTIPDYAAEVQGVKLSGVRGGSPAEKAGLKNGDVLIEFAGQKVANIYDYTYALDAARIGKPLEVVVVRDGKNIKVTVVPEARK